MNVYLVAAEAIEDVALAQTFPEHRKVQNGVWLVASTVDTTGEVAELLGMNDEHRRFGVVVAAGAYFGYHTKDLWEKIEAWKAR